MKVQVSKKTVVYDVVNKNIILMRSRVDVRICALNKCAEPYCASYIHINIKHDIFLSSCVVSFRTESYSTVVLLFT